MCGADIFLGLLAILFPPLPVWIKRGICSADSIINILLCILGYIPGLLHAWYIIVKFPEVLPEYEPLPQHVESGRVTYIVTAAAPGPYHPHPQKPHPHPQHKQGPAANYGTVGPTGQNSAGTSAAAGASASRPGADEPVPPTYAEAVSGHKIQT